jgi:hypothetical protein
LLLSASLIDLIDARISPSLSGSSGMTDDCVIVGENGDVRMSVGVGAIREEDEGGGVYIAVS